MSRADDSIVTGDFSLSARGSRATGVYAFTPSGAAVGFVGDRATGRPGYKSDRTVTLSLAESADTLSSVAQIGAGARTVVFSVTEASDTLVSLAGGATVANFTAVTPTSGAVPLSVSFLNQSANAASYLWTFPGGTPNSSAAASPTVVYSTPGNYDVTLQATGPGGTNSLTRPGYITASAAGNFAWSYSSSAEIPYARNSTVVVATGVPSAHQVQVSPNPMPSVTVSVSGTQVIAVGDDGVPNTAGAAAGTPEAATNARTRYYEVIPNNHLATLVNATKGITYSASSNNWNTMMAAADHGDTIEISPGYIHATQADMNNYFTNNLAGAMLAVWKRVNLKGMAGRGRWRIYAADDILTPNSPPRNACGIVLYAPEDVGGRGSVTFEDFEFDNWAQSPSAFGVYVMQNFRTVTNSWADFHNSVTLRNFKIGKRPFYRSGSGINGSAETLVIEDGHVYDCGGGIFGPSGNDHNFYITARNLTVRGVRSERTRGNDPIGWWEPGGANKEMDGHHLKIDANTATIEGCAFYCGPRGDSSITIQMKGGGNLIVRGCLLLAGLRTKGGNGMVQYEREFNTDGVTPNYITWSFGVAGHSVLLERNLFISHYPNTPYQRAILYFWQSNQPQHVAGVSSVIVRDNIAMHTVVNSATYIQNDPTLGGSWLARGNTQDTYTPEEAMYTSRELLAYLRKGGAPAASQGSQAIPRFVWPHGFESVTRSTQGLG